MLNWQFADTERFNKLTEEEKKWNDAFIWGCILVGLKGITEKNAEEWEWRYKFMVKLNGASYYARVGKEDKEWIPTLEDIKKRIGLTTNCDQKTRNQFIQSQVRIYSRK